MKQSRNGFTLIELVITFSIVVIVFGILSSLVEFSTRFFKDENSQIASQDALRIIAVDFEKDIRKYVVTSNEVGNPITNGTNTCYTLGSSTTIEYCYNSTDKTVKRANIVISNGIEIFTIVKSPNDLIQFNIQSISDNRGNFNNIVLDIYIRTARTG